MKISFISPSQMDKRKFYNLKFEFVKRVRITRLACREYPDIDEVFFLSYFFMKYRNYCTLNMSLSLKISRMQISKK